MKKTVLYGAGQYGAMALRLMGCEREVLCFADGNASRWGQQFCGVKILSPEEAVSLKPDSVCICVAGEERRNEIRQRLKLLGFAGELLSPDCLKDFDTRCGTMRMLAEQINSLGIVGDIGELGVFQGAFAAQLNASFPGRSIHLFDTFTGFDIRDTELERSSAFSSAEKGDFSQTGVETVLKRLPCPELAVIHKGYFPESFAGCEELRFAFVSIDPDLYAPAAAALPIFWDRLSPGGVLLIHDYNSLQFKGIKAAVDGFCKEKGLLPMPLCDMHGSAVLRKELTDEAV